MFQARALTIVLSVALIATTASAFSGGITSNFFFTPEQGCTSCHGGGTQPLIELAGPTVVAPSSTSEYTLRVFEVGFQNFAGFNAESTSGTLATGGSLSAGTQAIQNPVSLLDEVTHTAPKMAAAGVTEFSFLWTAPASFTSAVLNVWGNAVNLNANTAGDNADVIRLTVFNDQFDTPTATATATPTATPTPAFMCLDDLAPVNPAPIADQDLRKCQETVAKAAGLYVKKKIKAVQKCMNSFQKGNIGGDPVTACRGTAVTPPSDTKTAEKIDKAVIKLNDLIGKKCTDTLVAQLDSCDTTVPGLQTCIVADHWQLVDDMIQIEYGNLFESPDSGEQKCQKTIAGEGFKYLTKSLKAAQKCIDKRNKDESGVDAAALCIGSIAGGVYTPPSDTKTAGKIAKAATKLGDKLSLKCDSTQLAALASCGADVASETGCLICSHREGFISLLDTQYGGN